MGRPRIVAVAVVGVALAAVDLGDVLACQDGEGCSLLLSESNVFQSQWRGWLQKLEVKDGRCHQVFGAEWDLLRLRFGETGGTTVAVELGSSEALLWRQCRGLALLWGLAELEDEVHSSKDSLEALLRLAPKFLRHVVLREGVVLGQGEVWQLLERAEAQVIGAYRAKLSTFRSFRCDVCCSDASCPFAPETGLCPADSHFDANQDLRDRLWVRAEQSMEQLEHAQGHPVVAPFAYCDESSRRESTIMKDVVTVWSVLDKSSCIPQQVADAIYCYWQQRESWDIFSAAHTMQEAVLLQLFCNSCGPMWPLPFTFHDVWRNFFVAIRLAVDVMKRAQVGRLERDFLTETIWQTGGLGSFESSDFIRLQPIKSWHHCPLDLGVSRLRNGQLQVFQPQMAQTIKLQACQSGIVYEIQNLGRLGRQSAISSKTLLVLPLSDLFGRPEHSLLMLKGRMTL